MKFTLYTFLPLLVLCLSIKHVDCKDQWELEMDKDGIRVYTQLEENSPYKQVKVTATINAPMEKVMEILTAFNKYKNWMNNVHDSYLLNQSDSAYYVFILEDATWPMQNRYQVSKVQVNQELQTSSVEFKTVPNYIEKRTDAIQIKQFEGYWSLKDRPDRSCSLEYVLVNNPGGHVPPWLANLHAIDNPFQSVLNLKRLAEGESIRP